MISLIITGTTRTIAYSFTIQDTDTRLNVMVENSGISFQLMHQVQLTMRKISFAGQSRWREFSPGQNKLNPSTHSFSLTPVFLVRYWSHEQSRFLKTFPIRPVNQFVSSSPQAVQIKQFQQSVCFVLLLSEASMEMQT